MADRESQLVRTFAKLADTLVDDYDVVDLLQILVDTCTETLDVSAAGILLADRQGQLELIASTSEASRLVELIQLSSDAGPCIASYRTGRVVSVGSIRDSLEEWPRFRDSALAQGFNAAHAVPMRLREVRIGTLNLLSAHEGVLPPEDVLVSQALADVATIGILQNRAIRGGEELVGQLEHALNSRVIIEQAKGVIAYLQGITVDDAFATLRGYARDNKVGIAETARGVVDGTVRI